MSGSKRQQAEEVRRAKREAGEANAFGANKHFRCRQHSGPWVDSNKLMIMGAQQTARE